MPDYVEHDGEKVVVLDTLTKKERAALKGGDKFFVRKTGSYGVVLNELAACGKQQASLTCTLGGPNHVRMSSDWMQCGVSPEKRKKAKADVKVSAQALEKAEEVRAKLQTQLQQAKDVAGLK